MDHYEKARAKLTIKQLNKLTSSAKRKTGTTIRITKNNCQDEELSQKNFSNIKAKSYNNKCFH